MEILRVNNLSKSFGEKQLFSEVSFNLDENAKVGLIGKNGVGKSTLLKILVNQIDSDSGTIAWSKGIKVGYLEQQPQYPTETVREVVSLSFKEIVETSKKMRELEQKMSNNEGDLYLNVSLYGALQEKFDLLNGYDFDYKIDAVLNGLKLTADFCEKKFSQLSGGEKTKVLLAKLLIESPKVILLDEPTNYLDLESLKWLEDYINKFKGAVLIISHDRYFLDKIAEQIYELNVKGIDLYNGNYTYYLTEKIKRQKEYQKDYDVQQKKIKRMQEQIRWMQSTGSNVLKAKSHQIESRIQKMDKIEKPIIDNKKIRLAMEGSTSSKKKIIELESVSKSFEKPLFKNISGLVRGCDNVGIIGENGVGKTTLLNIFLGNEIVDSGYIKMGENINIGYLDQESKFLDENQSVLDFYCKETSKTTYQARSELAKMLFLKDDVFKKISSLSGGERKKLKLSVLLANKPTLLVLDEPTNHLDLPSREELEAKLLDFKGSIIFVSHDRYFLNKIANKIWCLRPEGLIQVDGNYDDYFLEISINEKSKQLKLKK